VAVNTAVLAPGSKIC